MYTIDDEKKDLYEDDDYETSNWDNRKGLIFKIIIIILCIIVLIWLIKALKSNRNQVDNGETHIANVEKVRLAAEDYFFLKDNKKKTSYVTLAGLKNNGLIGDIVDANNKVCNDNSTKVSLEDEPSDYKMTVRLSCSTSDKEEVFYYQKSNLACQNCNGKTYMDGKAVVIDDDKDNNKNNNDNKDDEYTYYSCVNWSDWTKVRVVDPYLTERTKTLVQGVKYGSKKTYGEWSDYTTTPIVSTSDIEVESKVITETLWSDPITSTEVDKDNKNIHIISKETKYESGGNNCSNGYISDGICYSNKVTTGNLTFQEYVSGNYMIKEGSCEKATTLPDKDGLYVLTYVNCQYNEKIGKASNKSGYSYTLYTYQVLETTNVTYYRYRNVYTVNEPDKYTDIKYEEKDLPSGYVKVDGSEETYYSYKLNTCEK